MLGSKWSRFKKSQQRLLRKFLRKPWLAMMGTLIIATALQACAPQLTPQEPCNFVMSAEQQRVSWKIDVPVTLYLDSSVPSHFQEPIQAAIRDWNQSLGREVLRLGGWSNRTSPGQDGANVIYFMNNWELDRSNEQARTTVFWAGSKIFEADLRINGRDFDYFTGSTPVAGKVDLQSLVLHELGHVLGLAHSESGGSVMAKSLPNAYLRRTPTSSDVSNMKCEY